jgi:catecholate siderophore receptor
MKLKTPPSRTPLSLRNELISGLAIAGLSIVALPHNAKAESAKAEISEAESLKAKDTVIVNGKRRAENPYADPDAPYRVKKSANSLITEELINTPKSIQAIPEELLEDMAMNTFRDLFRSQPGITLGTGEGGNAFGDRIFIRGFDARNDVYIDGVRDPGLSSREMFATQQIEIIKGPSSTFGGRGTTGGAVSAISKKPKAINTTSIEATIGTENTQRLTIDTNRVINDELAFRLNLMEQTGDIAGRDNVYSNRWGAALAATYNPRDNFELGFDYYHLSTDYMPDWGLPWNGLTNSVADVPRNTFYGIKGRDFGKTYSDVYSLNTDYEISDNLKLHSISRFGQTNNEYRATAPEGANFTANPRIIGGVTQPAYTVAANSKPRFQLTNYYTNQTNLKYDFNTGIVSHTLIGGFEISREATKMKSYSFTECGTPPCTGATARIFQDLYNPNFNYPWSVSAETALGHTQIETNTKALYFMDNIRFGEKWLAMIGLRGDNYQTNRNNVTYATNIWGTPVKSESDFLSYQAGVVYKPSINSSLYLNYGTSANPPCEQLDSTGVDYGGCTASTTAIDPIENASIEIGGKFNINDHLDVNIAFFNIERDKVPSVVSNILYLEKQSVEGFEIGANGNISKKLAIAAGFTMLGSNTISSTNPNSGNVGKSFPNISEMSSTLTLKYNLSDKIAFGGTWVSQSEKFGGTFASGNQKIPGFDRIDLMAEYEIKKGLELQFNMLNATNETYFDALYRSSTPYVYIAPGRSYSLMIDWHF